MLKMTTSNVLSSLIFLTLLTSCKMHKILVISHVPVKSHAFLINTLVKLLLEAGHEITQFAIMPTNMSHPNLRQIDISYNKNYVRDKSLKLYAERSKKIFTATLQHKDVQEVLTNTRRHFDLVIAEWMHNDIALGLAALYDCPFIWFSALESMWSVLQQIEEVASRYTSKNSYSYSTSIMMRELLLNSLDKEGFNTVFKPLMALRGKSLPAYVDIMYMCSLVFVYSPILAGEKSKWPQNFKPVGGYHINLKVKSLPKNLQRMMDNAKHGVIYFSLGSHLDSKFFEDEWIKELLEMFSRLEQTVFWKHESSLSNLSRNIYVTNWFPQQSVLSHPKCLLFITQGGVLSMTEAVYYAVPMIGVPLFGDQLSNIQNAVDSGIATRVPPTPTIANEMKNAIEEMLRNPSYRKKIKEQSFIYHGRSTPPRAEVVSWVNYVILKGVKKLEPKIAFFNPMHTNIVVMVITVIIALKYMFRQYM